MNLQQNCKKIAYLSWWLFSPYYLVKRNVSQCVHNSCNVYALKVMTVTKKHCSKCPVFAFDFETRIKTIFCHWSIARSVKFCWLLTTFQSDAVSAHWRPSLVSDKHVPACRFQSVSPGSGALVWFSRTQGWKWMVHITVMSCCSKRCCQTSVKSCWQLLLSRAPRVRKSTELLRHKTPYFTPDMASQQTRCQFCRLQIIENHSCVYQKQQRTSNIVDELWLTERHYYNSQGRVETPIRRGGQLCCCKFTSVSVCQQLSKYNAVWQSYCKNKGAIFSPTV